LGTAFAALVAARYRRATNFKGGIEMQRWKNLVWLSAGVLALGVIITAVAPGAIAQSRPTILVRDMDSAIRGTRYFSNNGFYFPTGSTQQSLDITPTIPAGKRLFIQRISTNAMLTNGQSISQFSLFIITQAGSFAIFSVVQVPQTVGHFAGNQDIDVLVGPGDQLFVQATRDGDLGNL